MMVKRYPHGDIDRLGDLVRRVSRTSRPVSANWRLALFASFFFFLSLLGFGRVSPSLKTSSGNAELSSQFMFKRGLVPRIDVLAGVDYPHGHELFVVKI